jgi:hypothetical protein
MSSAEAADVHTAAPAARPVAAGAQADEGHPARWWILAVLAAVSFMAQLDRNIICANASPRDNP